ncbi:MAG: bifunctional folylpolyglutamate synthase/dihydrofolate synthase [Planctomycetales bacterium]|nr:bifunctional folylpolyglutamate synthase/dihydrofolate synthase [Planctomycetales bacterium]
MAERTDYERMARPPSEPGAYDLGRMRRLCADLGDPQARVPCLHVAGTKGKGSVSAFAAALLSAPGRRVGLYTSPHLVSLRERIVVDGRPISEEDFVSAMGLVAPEAERLAAAGAPGGAPTFFEVTTAAAFVHFERVGVDVAVHEVGLGGRLDATNVVSPDATAIASIGLDHTALLGTTLDSIAREKAGILKPGVPAVTLAEPPEALAAIADVAGRVGAPLRVVPRDIPVEADLLPGGGWRVAVGAIGDAEEPGGPLEIRVRGGHQPWNLALAVAAVQDLHGRTGLPLDGTAGRAALERLRLPGRLDLVLGRPRLLLDGAHTPPSVRAFAREIEGLPRPRVVVLAAMRDKDLPGLLRELAGPADRLVATTAGTPRSADPGEVARRAREAGIGAVEEQAPAPEALDAAVRLAGPAGTVGVTGSLYLAGAAYAHLGRRAGYGPGQLPVLGPSWARDA